MIRKMAVLGLGAAFAVVAAGSVAAAPKPSASPDTEARGGGLMPSPTPQACMWICSKSHQACNPDDLSPCHGTGGSCIKKCW